MGHLHRFFARNATRIWEVETRVMRRLGWVRPPAAVQWITTSACELECPHCYSHAGSRAEGELTTDEAKRFVVDELVAMGCPQLVLAGGEPLLRRDFAEIVAYCASRGVGWSLHTHGRLVRRQLDVFRRYPPKMVAVSIDGPEAFHDGFRGRAGTYAEAMAAIRALSEIPGVEVIVGTTVTRRNADLLADLQPAVMASGAHGWGLHLFAPEGRGAEHRALVPTPAQLRRVAAFARRRRGSVHVELDNEWGSAGPDDAFYRDDPFLCGAGRFTCVVSVTGEVVPCTTTDVAESEGNVRERPLSALWAAGFGRFRSAGDAQCSDGGDCWLQVRNDNSCRISAFAPVSP